LTTHTFLYIFSITTTYKNKKREQLNFDDSVVVGSVAEVVEVAAVVVHADVVYRVFPLAFFDGKL
jgi:hypothetical protein